MADDVNHYRGDTFEYTAIEPYLVGGQPADITGLWVYFYGKRDANAPDAAAEIRLEYQALAGNNSQAGKPSVKISAAQMDLIATGRLHCGFQVVDPSAPDSQRVREFNRFTLIINEDLVKTTNLPVSAGTPQLLAYATPALHTTDTTIPVATFTAVNGDAYMAKLGLTQPLPADTGWQAFIPTGIPTTGEGSYQTSGWVKLGNQVSPAFPPSTTVIDLPSVVQWTVGNNTANEGGQLTLSAQRSGHLYGALTLNITQVGGNASTSDYSLSATSMSWASGDGNNKSVSMTITADGLTENAENVVLRLSVGSGQATYGANRDIDITINDTSVTPAAGTLGWTQSSWTIAEGGSLIALVRRTGGSAGVVQATVGIVAGTATASDYNQFTAVVSFTAGDTADKQVIIGINEDSLAEGQEYFDITLSNITGGAAGGQTTARVYITDSSVGVEDSLYRRDYYATATGAGSHNGTIGNEWSYDEAYDNTPAGMHCMLGPGTATNPVTGNKWIPAFRVANPGTPGNPTVLYAQYPAALNPNNPSLWTNLRHNGTLSGSHGPVIGSYGESNIILDGFAVDENYALPAADTGPCVINTLGSQVNNVTIRRCRLIGMTPTHSGWGDTANQGQYENHCGVRVENAYAIVIEDNYISGFRNPRDSHNGAGFMSYANGWNTYDITVRYNHFDNCGTGVYAKGQITVNGTKYYQSEFKIYANKFSNCTRKSVYLNGLTGTVGGRSSVYLNVFQPCIPNLYDGFVDYRVIDFGTEVSRVDVVNNTAYGFDNYIDRGVGTVSDCNVKNNVGLQLHANALSRYFFSMQTDARAALQPDNNCYFTSGGNGRYNYLGTNYTTLSAFVAAMGGTYEANSLAVDPLLVDPANGDYRLQDTANGIGAGTSPSLNAGVDILNLKGAGTSGPINMGAFITAGQTDQKGPRT